jgi:hypothetical protein
MLLLTAIGLAASALLLTFLIRESTPDGFKP